MKFPDYTHQHYPKWRHRLTKDRQIESRRVEGMGDELRDTPDADGWVDLARDLFDAKDVPIAIEAAERTAKAVPKRGGPFKSDWKRGGPITTD